MPLGLRFLAWSKKPAQAVDGIPEVQVVPGEEAGSEIGLTDDGVNVLASKVAGGDFSMGFLQDGDGG